MLREALLSSEFTSEDDELNGLLESARQKFSSPDFRTRYDALKDLWDAFERLKTLEPPRNDKRQSSAALIARVSQEQKIHEMLDAEMRVELEGFGNGFFIGHAQHRPRPVVRSFKTLGNGPLGGVRRRASRAVGHEGPTGVTA